VVPYTLFSRVVSPANRFRSLPELVTGIFYSNFNYEI
jgi:hypothetical protein